MLQKSRWELSDAVIEAYVARSFDYIVDYLNRREESIAAGLDPIGDQNLGLSKKIRRMALREGAWRDPGLLLEMADNFFPLPEVPFGYWKGRERKNGDLRIENEELRM